MSKTRDHSAIRYVDRDAYLPAATYAYGDLVTYAGARYVYTGPTPAAGVLPTTASSWVPYSSPGAVLTQEWTVGTTYNPGDLVTSNGSTYRVQRRVTATAAARPDYLLVNRATPPSTSLAASVASSSSSLTSSEVPSGAYRRNVLTSTPAANVYPGHYAFPSALTTPYLAALPGQRVLLRAWVRYSVATTVMLAYGSVSLTAASVSNPTTLSVSAGVPVAANTWTQIQAVVTAPPSVATAPNLWLGAYATPGTVPSGASIETSSLEFIPLPEDVADADVSGIPSIGLWNGEPHPAVGGSIYRSAAYAPFSQVPVVAPARVAPDRSIGTVSNFAVYDATRTYQPGEQVLGPDGTFFEAIGFVEPGEQPVRYNLCANPRALFGTDGWNAAIPSQVGGNVTLVATTDTDGTPVFRYNRTYTGSEAASSSYFPIAECVFWQDSDAVVVSLKISTDISGATFSLRQTFYDQTGNYVNQTTALLPPRPTGVLSTRTGALSLPPGFLSPAAANGWRSLRLEMDAITFGAQLQGNVRFTDVCINPVSLANVSNQTARLSTFFSGSESKELPSTYSVAWRGVPNSSKSIASCNKWRMVAPGARPGRTPVQITSLMGDVEYHYNAGERTMGGV